MPNARRLITVDQILEIAKDRPFPEDFLQREDECYLSPFAKDRGLPICYVKTCEPRLWDMDAQVWVDDTGAEASPQPRWNVAPWRDASPVRSYCVRADGAILGEVTGRHEGLWEVGLFGSPASVASAVFIPVWTSLEGARAELARVCRVLGWAA